MFENLQSCVLHLRVFAFSYIMTAHILVESSFSASQETPNHMLKTRKDTAKLNWDFLLFS
jgi:hypothetical protein